MAAEVVLATFPACSEGGRRTALPTIHARPGPADVDVQVLQVHGKPHSWWLVPAMSSASSLVGSRIPWLAQYSSAWARLTVTVEWLDAIHVSPVLLSNTRPEVGRLVLVQRVVDAMTTV